MTVSLVVRVAQIFVLTSITRRVQAIPIVSVPGMFAARLLTVVSPARAVAIQIPENQVFALLIVVWDWVFANLLPDIGQTAD